MWPCMAVLAIPVPSGRQMCFGRLLPVPMLNTTIHLHARIGQEFNLHNTWNLQVSWLPKGVRLYIADHCLVLSNAQCNITTAVKAQPVQPVHETNAQDTCVDPIAKDFVQRIHQSTPNAIEFFKAVEGEAVHSTTPIATCPCAKRVTGAYTNRYRQVRV